MNESRRKSCRCPKVVPVDISASVFVYRSPNEVFDYVMEVGNDVLWRTGVVAARYTSDGPVGVGTTGFDRVEANGKTYVSEWTIVEFESGSHARRTSAASGHGFGLNCCSD
jgi:hypothetical protein